MATYSDNKRQFRYTDPIMYMGEEYPTANATVLDENGNEVGGTIFTDAKGQYYSVDDNGNAVKVMPTHTLSEATVIAPKYKTASDYFADYLTMSNDATKVLNAPHREYNRNLRESTLRGAEAHAAWEKEHSNLTAWSYAAGAAPFAVAAAPFVAGAGDALAGTALGQGITNNLGLVADAASNSTWLPWLNTGLSSVFAANGLQDVQNGRFTPQTAMDLMPLAQLGKPMYEAGNGLYDVAKDWRPFGYMRRYYPAKTAEDTKFISSLDWSPEGWFGKYRPGGYYDEKDVAALERHIPEYHRIEKEAKANGTWLRDGNGKMQAMDPREWVIRQSSDYKIAGLTGVNHYNGVAGDKALNYSYNGTAWTDLEKDISNSFKLTHSTVDRTPGVLLQLDYPTSVKEISFDAKDRLWHNLPKDNFIEGYPVDNNATANEAVRQAYNQGYEVVRFNNIVEGNNHKVTDVVIQERTPRKSVLGNNGDFNLLDKNIYRSLIPFTIPIGLTIKKHK